jgi:hypothetical protein
MSHLLRVAQRRYEIQHHERWANEFFETALATERQLLLWSQQGSTYLVDCLTRARDAHLASAVIYEGMAQQLRAR